MQNVLRKILEKVFITKKYTQCKTGTLKIDVLKNWKSFFQNMSCFSRIKLIPVLIHLKYLYWNTLSLDLPCLSHHICGISPWSIETLFNTIFIMLFITFPIFSYNIRTHTTTGIGYTKPYAKPSQSNLLSIYIQITITYESNTLPIKKPSL